LDGSALLVIGLFVPVALIAVIGFQSINPRSAPTWEYPSRRSNLAGEIGVRPQ
jgi:hypothetical protein